MEILLQDLNFEIILGMDDFSIELSEKPIELIFEEPIEVERSLDRFLSKKENIDKFILPLIPKVENGKDGKNGKNGKDGEDGTTPVKGKDYFTNKELTTIKKAIKDTILAELPKSLTEDEISVKIREVIGRIEFTRGGVQFLRQLVDVKGNDLQNLTYGLRFNKSTNEFTLTETSETDTLQSVTDRGNTTDNTINAPAIEYQTTYTPTGNEPVGTTFWEGHGLVTIYENGARYNHGFELYTFGTDEGNDFPEGSAVSVKGATGNRVAFELTDITDNESVINYIGLLTTPVDSGNRLATREGAVNGIKTNYTGTGAWGTTWAEGQQIYVSSVAGGLTNIRPASGRVIRVGTVTNVHGTQGVIELDRLVVPTIEEIATFEVYNKNLSSYPYTITETSGTITTLVYTTPTGTITKVITEVSPTITTIVLSGIPAGLPTTKTITEGTPSTVTYS